jgi:hypothetical protein
MTFFHFINCSLLTFLPLFTVYRATALYNQSGSLTNVGIGGLFYLLSQLAKLVLIALLFSSFEEGNKLIVSHEIIKVVLGAFDVSGIYIAFKQSSPTSSLFYRLLSVGLGWTVFHHVAYYLPQYWIHARSLQFTEDSMLQAIASLSYIIILLSLPFLTYVALKKRKEHFASSLLASLGLFFVVTTGSLIKFLAATKTLDEYGVVAAQFVWAAVIAGLTNVAWRSIEVQ